MSLRLGFANTGALIVVIGMVSLVYFAYKMTQVVQSLPMRYYNSLPVAISGDADRDGILDYYDDSDGDGIADHMDPTPF